MRVLIPVLSFHRKPLYPAYHKTSAEARFCSEEAEIRNSNARGPHGMPC
jgi:hypothetical protein